MEILGKKMPEETSISDKNRYHRLTRKQSRWWTLTTYNHKICRVQFPEYSFLKEKKTA